SGRDVAEILKDAVLLSNTGVLDGVVVSAKGKALAHVNVQCGHLQRTTDKFGRFRAQRVRQRGAVHVRLAKAGYVPLARDVQSVALPEVVGSVRFVLRKGKAPRRRPLSELDGDVLPRYDGTRVEITPRVVSQIPEGEVVRYQGTLATGQAKLSSRFMRWDTGRFQVVQYRIPAAKLPAGAAAGMDFLVVARGPQHIEPRRTALRVPRAGRR